jgi:hypothetical protein
VRAWEETQAQVAAAELPEARYAILADFIEKYPESEHRGEVAAQMTVARDAVHEAFDAALAAALQTSEQAVTDGNYGTAIQVLDQIPTRFASMAGMAKAVDRKRELLEYVARQEAKVQVRVAWLMDQDQPDRAADVLRTAGELGISEIDEERAQRLQQCEALAAKLEKQEARLAGREAQERLQQQIKMLAEGYLKNVAEGQIVGVRRDIDRLLADADASKHHAGLRRMRNDLEAYDRFQARLQRNMEQMVGESVALKSMVGSEFKGSVVAVDDGRVTLNIDGATLPVNIKGIAVEERVAIALRPKAGDRTAEPQAKGDAFVFLLAHGKTDEARQLLDEVRGALPADLVGHYADLLRKQAARDEAANTPP